MNQDNGKGIIFGVLGILTLIIAIMGASLAYFTATAKGTPDEVTVQATTVAISYTQGQNLVAEDLIPAEFSVVDWAYKRGVVQEDGLDVDKQCIDNQGYKVCGVYRFEVSNEYGTKDATIEGTITTETNVEENEEQKEFENLMYTVYEVTKEESGNVISRTEINSGNHTKFGKVAGTSTTQLFNRSLTGGESLTANQVSVPAGQKKYYEVLIWLNEVSENVSTDDGSGAQDFEQGLKYKGTLSIKLSGVGDKITGEIGQ